MQPRAARRVRATAQAGRAGSAGSAAGEGPSGGPWQGSPRVALGPAAASRGLVRNARPGALPRPPETLGTGPSYPGFKKPSRRLKLENLQFRGQRSPRAARKRAAGRGETLGAFAGRGEGTAGTEADGSRSPASSSQVDSRHASGPSPGGQQDVGLLSQLPGFAVTARRPWLVAASPHLCRPLQAVFSLTLVPESPRGPTSSRLWGEGRPPDLT